MRRLVRGLGAPAGLLLALASAGCLRSASTIPPPLPSAPPSDDAFALSRGDWLVGEQAALYAALEHPFQGAPVRIGYVSERHYREVRGGPILTMYEVYGLDRTNAVGLVDGLGNAKRFRPRRGGGIDVESLGSAPLPLSVQAILGTTHPVTLERTSERALAFEALDKNGDKVLDATEYPRLSTKVSNPDTNRDGKVDFQEFMAADAY
jgi:hypothetical protein